MLISLLSALGLLLIVLVAGFTKNRPGLRLTGVLLVVAGVAALYLKGVQIL